MTRRRLDVELVRRGLATSREQAREAVAAGSVLVAGALADKPSRLVDAADPVSIIGPPPRFVSRGGLKLDAALERFGIDVAGRRALDAGASTGGFTDCLLQRGAASVVALDVGRGQLDERLRQDPRVVVCERTDVRSYKSGDAQVGNFEVVVADLSFISLRSVARALLRDLAAPGAEVVVLIKPQFEAGRRAASAGKGVIRDPVIWAEVLRGVISALTAQGAAMMGLMVSPVTGAEGNVEFLAHLRAGVAADPTAGLAAAGQATPAPDDDQIAAAVAAAVAAVAAGQLRPGTGPGTGTGIGSR